jgi:hypothetical protein
MAAHLYPGIKSLKLVLDTPYDTIRTADIRDDLISVKVWYSATSGFNPETQGIVVPSGNSLNVDIPNLTPNTTYYVRYAFISAIDPAVYTISNQLSETVLEENVSVYGYLTNDPTPIVTQADGSGGSFTSANGVFKVFNLSTEVTGAGPAYSIKANSTTGITTPTINATTGVYSCSGLTEDVGTVTFRAVYNGVTIEQVWNVYRAKAGQTAPLLQLSATTTEFVYKDQSAASSLTPQTVITARLVNLTGNPTFTAEGFTRDGTSLGTINFTQTNNVITITQAQFDARGVTIGNVRVTATLGSATDVITIYRINDGTEQITVELSNEAHVIPADSNGDTVEANYIGSGTTIKVKQGNTYLLVDNVADPTTGLFDVGTWRVTTITSVGITCDTTPGVYTNYIEYDKHSAMTADVATITYTITGTTTTGATFSINKVQSFSKTTDGVNGTSPLIYSINPSAPVITKQAKDAATAGVHSSITIQGKRYNGVTTTNYGWVTVTSNLGSEAATPTDTASTPATLSPADNAGVLFYTVKLYKESTISAANLVDTQVIYVLFKGATGVDGAPAISAILGNETHIFPAAFDGTISAPSYAGSGTTIRVYEGAQELVYTGTGTSVPTNEPGTWKLWVYEQGGFSNISIGTFTDSGNYATVGDHSGVAAGIDTSSITYNIYGRNSLGTQFNITKTQTFSKSKTGAPGANATAYWLTVSDGALRKAKSGTISPASITVYGYSATGTGAPVAYAGRFIIYENGSATPVYTSAANESSKLYTLSSNNVTSVKVELYLAGGTTTKLDEQSIPVLVDGSDTVTAILSNESATVPAANNGDVSSFAGAATTMSVFIGATDDSANWTYAAVKSGTTITFTEATNSRTQTVSALTASSGHIDITASKTGYPSITKRFNVSKAFAGGKGDKGDQGDPGATGVSNYRIYKASANSATPPTTNNVAPPATTDGAAPSTWSLTPVTLTAGQAQWQSDGVRAAGTTGVANNTTWSVPYLSYFKVDTLEAITTNTGKLNVNDTIKVGTVTVNAQDNPVDGVLITTSGIKIYNAGILRVNLGSI